MHKKNRLIKRILVLIMALAVLGLTTASLAWFSGVSTKNMTKVSGHVQYIPEYFGGGDGKSADTPYLIQTKEQYANFAWLQYLGYFNEDSHDFGSQIDTVYFKLDPIDNSGNHIDTLDLSGCVLPPVGTSSNPFIGNFDGNYKTIANLTVTNSSDVDAYTFVPQAMVDGTVSNAEIIGVFGVVGKIDGTEYSYDTSANVVKNMNVSNITIKTATPQALAGVSAGYVNGTLQNVGVLDSNVDNTNGSTALSYTTNLSDYTLVGYCTEAYLDKTSVTIEEIERPEIVHKEPTDDGAGVSWGGSIAMRDLYKRVQSMSNTSVSNGDYVTYPTEVTIYRNDNTGTEEEIVEATATNRNIWNYQTDMAGSAAVTLSNDYYICLYGYKEIPATQKITVKGYLYDKAYFIADGENLFYLCVDDDGTIHSLPMIPKTEDEPINAASTETEDEPVNITSAETEDESPSDVLNTVGDDETDELIDEVDVQLEMKAGEELVGTMWLIEDPTTGELATDGYLRTLKEPYIYLNKDDNNQLVAEDAPTTTWHNVDGRIYIEEGLNTYFLVCSKEGVWRLDSDIAQQCYITDVANNVSRESNDILGINYSIINDVNKAADTRWVLHSSGTGYKFSFNSFWGRTFYLTADANGNLSLPRSGTGTQFEYNGSEFYYNGKYLVYEDGVWKLREKQVSGYTISQGNEFLSREGTNVVNIFSRKGSAGLSEESFWQRDNQNRYYQVVGDTTYYLRATTTTGSSPTLTTSVNNATSFTSNADGSFTFGRGSSLRNLIFDFDTETWKVAQGKAGDISVKSLVETLPAIYLTPVELGGIGSQVFVETYDDTSTPTERVEPTVEKTKPYTTPDTYLPINASVTDPYTPDPNNTGYIMSGAQSDTANVPKVDSEGDIRLSGERFGYYNLGFSNNNASLWGGSYQGPELQIITQTANSNGPVRIIDEYNRNNLNNANQTLRNRVPNTQTYESLGLQKYAASRADIAAALVRGGMYGLHFMDASISQDNLLTIPQASINGVDYADYEMPRDAIDFTLQDSGFINFFAGSYYTGNNSFFSIHEVVRDEEHKITAINEIQKVYSGGSDGKYVYEYTDGTFSANNTESKTLAFDMTWVKNPSVMLYDSWFGNGAIGVRGALYYYEVPVNKGEYALGSVDGKTGAYLLYLDISSNAQGVDQTTTTERMQTITSELKAPKGVDWLTDVTENDGNDADISNSAAMSLPSGSAQTYAVSRQEAIVTVTPTTAMTGSKVTYTDGTVTVVASDGSHLPLLSNPIGRVVREVVTIDALNTITKVNTKTINKITNVYDAANTITSKTFTTKVDITKDGVVISEGQEIAVEESDENPIAVITLSGDVVLRYYYRLPTDATVTTSQLFTKLGGSPADDDGITGRYDITVNSSTPFEMSVDTVDTAFNTSTLNGTIMTAGAVIDSRVA